MNQNDPDIPALTRGAGAVTVGALVAMQAKLRPDAIAIVEGRRELSYAAFNARVNRLAHVLAARGIGRGERLALLAENRAEYLETECAAAKLGAIVACQNWRLADPELVHCLRLTTPRLLIVSPRFAEVAARIEHGIDEVLELGPAYEALLDGAPDHEPEAMAEVDPEDGLTILYTSGTTGLPKGAVISHRAAIARAQLMSMDMGVEADDTYVAWAPFFHMVSTDPGLGSLIRGGKIIVMDGFDPAALADVVAAEELGWLVLMPGMIEPLIDELKRRNTLPRGIKTCGAMADLVPRHQIAEITRLLDAPYVNTFGSTETGLPPATASLLAVGEVPENLATKQNSLTLLRLVDADDNDVPDGTPGEAALRTPCLFSGYWNNAQANAEDFRGGWFHMGDMFVRNPDGSLDFVDRAKYLIKSGGENIYPAEIERVLLADGRVDDAVVVRRADAKWGEVPVAFVARNDEGLGADELKAACRRELAGYKQPKEIRFVALDELPRSTTGKIQRHEIERWLEED